MPDESSEPESRAYYMRTAHDAGLHEEIRMAACDDCFDQLDAQPTVAPERQRFERAFSPPIDDPSIVDGQLVPHKFAVFTEDGASKNDRGVWCRWCNTTRNEIPGMHLPR